MATRVVVLFCLVAIVVSDPMQSRRRWLPPPIPVPVPTPPPGPPPVPTPFGPGAGPWDRVTPEFVGLSSAALDNANNFIMNSVLGRQCFLLIKDGKLAYEWYGLAPDPEATPTKCQVSPVQETNSEVLSGRKRTCVMNSTYGCQGTNSMWVTGRCSGKFNCNGQMIECLARGRRPTECACGLENKPHAGYSMTKTIGGFLILLAATMDGLNIDADITATYGVQSPRPYPVTLRMMMAQIIAGPRAPGELWRYDELGDMWLHLMPKVILAATKHDASYYMDVLQKELGLSEHFAWPDVNTQWYRGASGTCRDWARFGQLILNRGSWGGKDLISPKYIDQMSKPIKVAPFNEYSNPCYGLLVWLNADKSKTPGCCWEASRLPAPKCNNDTFMPGAVHDMTLIIGLYGQIVMTLPSVNTVVVGFGTDLRPIEPARLGYYPGLCKALGLPCNTPDPVPTTKCGETLQCSGVSAQCFSGGAWNHSEPVPGKEQCISCFQNALPYYEKKFPEAHGMVKDWCPQKPIQSMKFIHCFCYGDSNPFGPWPTTTTTTLPLSPYPPLPPPGPMPAPPPLGPQCQLSAQCTQTLAQYKCAKNGGRKCYRCLHGRRKALEAGGCPSFQEEGFMSRGFCWCGYAQSAMTDDELASANGDGDDHVGDGYVENEPEYEGNATQFVVV